MDQVRQADRYNRPRLQGRQGRMQGRVKLIGAAVYEKVVVFLEQVEKAVVVLGLFLGLLVLAMTSLLIVGLTVGVWKILRS